MPEAPPKIGAWPSSDRTSPDRSTTHFRVWAPEHDVVELALQRPGSREFRALTRDSDGFWSAELDDVRPGDRYCYRLGGDNACIFPDPASRYQPDGVHGVSEVVDTAAFRWTDQDWRPPRAEDLVIYELHIGTFSRSGTFRAAAERLAYLAQLGVTAIELMPVGDFPGCRNWGYDGVAIFAPSHSYGRPEDLQALVDAAHQHGIAVILDVVYNHFGPDGAYANAFSPYYFTDRHRSPWGQGVNIDGPHSGPVREFFIANALYWTREYHIDGLRLDATHAIQDDGPRHFLQELTAAVRGCSRRPVFMFAEDHRNLATLLRSPGQGGWGLDGVWADDFHHQVRVHVAGDREGYYEDFTGSTDDLASTIRQGWFYTGQRSKHHGAPRGTDPAGLEPRQFVVCIQNHDQVGNRADGARLNHQVDAATFRAVSTLLLTVPETPLLFQGQEWATNAPFLFFTDHGEEIGRLVTYGRREEFASFAAFADATLREKIPDPQAASTFERSQLPWEELERPEHASMLRLYQRVIGLRSTAGALREASADSFDVSAPDAETVVVARRGAGHRICIVVRLRGGGVVTLDDPGARVLLTTEDADLAPDPAPLQIATHAGGIDVRFMRPGAAILQIAGA